MQYTYLIYQPSQSILHNINHANQLHNTLKVTYLTSYFVNGLTWVTLISHKQAKQRLVGTWCINCNTAASQLFNRLYLNCTILPYFKIKLKERKN